MKTFKARHTAETTVELPEGSTMEQIIAAHQAALAANIAAVTTTAVKYTSAKMLAELRRCHAAGIGVPNGAPSASAPAAPSPPATAETPVIEEATIENLIIEEAVEETAAEEVIIDPDTGEAIDIDSLFSAVQAEAGQG